MRRAGIRGRRERRRGGEEAKRRGREGQEGEGGRKVRNRIIDDISATNGGPGN